jgi:phasin family protein
MYSPTEQFADFNKVNVTQAAKIASVALENTERLVTLNMNAVKLVLATGVEGVNAVASVKDVQDLLTLRAKYAETGVETATAYTRSLYEISSQAQAQFTALAGGSLVELYEGHRGVGREGHQERPGRLGNRRQRVQVDVRRSTAAFDQIQKATKQVVSFADASVRAASANAPAREVGVEGSQGCLRSAESTGRRRTDRRLKVLRNTCIFLLLLRDTAWPRRANLRGIFLCRSPVSRAIRPCRPGAPPRRASAHRRPEARELRRVEILDRRLDRCHRAHESRVGSGRARRVAQLDHDGLGRACRRKQRGPLKERRVEAGLEQRRERPAARRAACRPTLPGCAPCRP